MQPDPTGGDAGQRDPWKAPPAFIGERPRTGGRLRRDSGQIFAFRIERSGPRAGFVAYGSRHELERAIEVADRRAAILAAREGHDVTFRVLSPSGRVVHVVEAKAPAS